MYPWIEQMEFLIYAISLLLAAVLGFTVHRASLCTVRTVAELFSTRKAHMAAAILKTVLWVIAVAVPILIFFPDIAAPNRTFAVSIAATLGGFLFGVGAAINDGCAFSTLWHLANGNLWMLTTLFGYCLGVAAMSIFVPVFQQGHALTPLLFEAPNLLIYMVLALLWFFLCREAFRLWKTRAMGFGWRQLLLSRRYRMSTAALVLGFSGGGLYTLHDTWTYTNVLKQNVQSLWLPIEKPETISLLLFLALVFGDAIVGMAARQLAIAMAPFASMASPSYRGRSDGCGRGANSRGQ